MHAAVSLMAFDITTRGNGKQELLNWFKQFKNWDSEHCWKKRSHEGMPQITI